MIFRKAVGHRGKLIAPWATELTGVWRRVTADLNGRELVIDVNGLTAISEEGESVRSAEIVREKKR